MKHLYSIFVIILAISLTTAAQTTTYYVNYSTGNDTHAGTSWSMAFKNLTKALAVAQSSASAEVDVWVAGGVYTAADGITSLPADHRDTSFSFYRGAGVSMALKVYGGFAGTESSISARDTSHVTYLEGILGTDNSFHIGVVAGLSATADSVVLDGLTFRDGKGTSTGSKTFNGVSIERFNGGGLAVVNNLSPRLMIRNCIFLNNETFTEGYSSYGAGIYINNSRATILKSKFTGNLATGDYYATTSYNSRGGAIYANAAFINLISCSFISNTATVDGNYGYSSAGGAVSFYNCPSPVVYHCTFSNNAATNSSLGCAGVYGGAIYNSNSNAQIKGCSFDGNEGIDNYICTSSICYYADLGGGAVYNRHSGPALDSNTFTNNQTSRGSFNTQAGGAVYDSASTTIYTHCTFANNGCNIGGTIYTSYGSGGAIYNLASADSITNCSFSNNIANNGGAIDNENGGYTWMSNCDLSYNSGGFGGAVSEGSGAHIFLRNNEIHNNIAFGQGGGIYCFFSNFSISNCHIYQNSSFTTAGGIYVGQDTLQIIDSNIIENNYASGNGGGILADIETSLSPTHCVFRGNTSGGEGGAICFTGAYTAPVSLVSNGNFFLYNNAQNGGAISVDHGIYPSGTDTVINSVFIENTSTGTTYSSGGAIYATNSTHFICNNTFAYDSATRGGAIGTSGSGCYMTLANNIFYNCYGSLGSSNDTALHASGLYYIFHNLYTGSNPMFINAANPAGSDTLFGTADDGLALQHCSPAVNAGDNSYIVADELIDAHHTARIIGGTVDLGAYEMVSIGAITGTDTICRGHVVTFSDTTAGGTWASSNPAIATIGTASGVVTAVGAGTATISYSHVGTCSSDIANRQITVVRPPSVITGSDSVCQYASIMLSDSVTGGSWASSAPGVATVSSTGSITGVSAGTSTITYHVVNACGTSDITKPITVSPLPALATLTGPDTVCQGAALTLSSSVPNGIWSTVFGFGAASDSIITGVNPGIDTVKYIVTNSCGSTVANYTLTVFSTAFCDSASSLITVPENSLVMSIFPNPAQGFITIGFPSGSNDPAVLVIFSVLGEKIGEWTLSCNLD